jgi:uncharacterized membrane protein
MGYAKIFDKSSYTSTRQWFYREIRGKSIIETGIYLLVLTPIMQVMTSMMLLIVKERDWLYAGITLMVFVFDPRRLRARSIMLAS